MYKTVFLEGYISTNHRRLVDSVVVVLSGLCRIAWNYFQLQQNCLYDI